VVRVVGGYGPGRLRVAGEAVPGRWRLSDSRGDVWVAVRVGSDDYESQWWGKGATPHPMPPSPGAMLRGGVVISPDAHWIAWTRPAGDVDDRNPPRVMEVVDTATGKVRWTRPAGADAPDLGALAVTDDGVVVFAHCTEPVFDSGGWPQCDDARVHAWAPEGDVTSAVPAGVSADHGPPGTVTVLRPLVQTTGAHNGLLVRREPSGPAQYVRLGARGKVVVVATLPPRTVAVTADERHAVVTHGCRHSAQTCRWVVVSLDGGERRPLRGVDAARAMLYEGFASFVAERGDLVVVQSRVDVGLPPTLARCSLAQARCVRIRDRGSRPGTTAKVASMVNGRIQGIEDYLARARPACDDCYLEGGAFDPETGALLVTSRRRGSGRLVGLSVVGADRSLADLSCREDLPCRGPGDGAQALGPGADELTVLSSRHEVQVIGYDGTRRRTIDLSALLDGSTEVRELAWSPDGGRLAVTTRELGSGLVSRIWLVNRDGADPQLVHTASYDGPSGGTPLTYIWSLGWSPDGRRLGFVEEQARLYSLSEESLSIRAVSLLLPERGQQGPGTPTTLYEYVTRPFDEAAFLWSPDGTRVAVRTRDRLLELSAHGTRRSFKDCDGVLVLSPEDASVLARHSFACAEQSFSWSPLIWPALKP